MKKIVILFLVLPLLSFNSELITVDIIGKWAGENKGKLFDIIFEEDGYATFVIDGQILGGKEFVLNGKKGKMTYEINSEKKPVEIDFTITKIESNEQKKIVAIAKFEDDNNMIIAMAFDTERPTEFNEENSIRLKRVE